MFCRHADYLAAHGVNFPRFPVFDDVAAGAVSSGNGGAIAALIGRDGASRHYSREDGLQALRALYETYDPVVLYSSEAMALFEKERLAFAADFATSAGYLTQAVYYLRDESDYASSVYARSTATGRTVMWRDAYMHKYVPPFARHLRELRAVLGESNVIVRDYDFSQEDLFGDFCTNVLGIARPRGEMPWLNSSAEQSAPASAFEQNTRPIVRST